ncbi:MAG TPA: ATP-binding cassette domain-containing protein [Candidatus Fermentibacter sp.]|nr:ATP-binding cassette domain-containing protein [Candidatus Fermentibacter sp.]
MTSGAPLMETVRLTGGYDGLKVLDGVSMKVLKGEILVIVGRSGCGKSTLMNHLLGLVKPWAGEVLFEGIDIWSDEAVLARARRRWGVLFQSGALLGSLTLLENVMLPLEEFTDLSPSFRVSVAMDKLGKVGLEKFADAYPLEVSGGMQKRAGLARAMSLDPEVLFFDEPSAGLDPVTSAGLDDLILRINRLSGTTMVIVTHELPSIFAISDRVVMLDSSVLGVVAEGTAEQLRDSRGDDRVEAFFGRRAPGADGGQDVS